MPLYFVGLGLKGARSLTLEGAELLKLADRVYLDAYTTPIEPSLVAGLRELRGDLKLADREFLEDGKALLEEARSSKVVVLSYGDPMIATTHESLATRARKAGIETRIIHNSSIVCSVCGELGLHTYKVGKVVSVVGGRMGAVSAYFTLLRNLSQRLHTIMLLGFKGSEYLSPSEALASLLEVESKYRHGAIGEETSALVCSRIGMEGQRIVGGKVGSLLDEEFGPPPHTLVFPATLHFTEEEALSSLGIGVKGNEVPRLSELLVRRYEKKTRAALKSLATEKREGLSDLLENVECYLDDSLRFLGEGKDELALLAMGYAEGLLDSLRLLGICEVEW